MKFKYLSEEEIKKEIDYYLYNIKTKYALLLNGSWGSGKTYFIKNEIIKDIEEKYKLNKKTKNKDRKPVYVSLYGLKDVSEIKNKIMLSLIKNKKIKQLLPILEVSLDTCSEVISSKYIIQESSKKLNKILNSFCKLDNLVIVFDDLERCNISINLVLGYINELVEHNNTKIIIVADESKIGKTNYINNLELKYLTALNPNIVFETENDKNINNENKKMYVEEIKKRAIEIFGEDDLYKEIKEKLIGKVIYYRADINKVYDTFLTQIITNEYAKEILEKNKKDVIEKLENNNCNLRTLQFVFESFNRLVNESICLVDLGKLRSDYLSNLLLYCVMKSLQIRRGENSYNWTNGQEFGIIYLGNKTRGYIYNNYVYGFRFVDDYLSSSMLDHKIIKKAILQYIDVISSENNNPNDPLNKLKTWWLVPEEELRIIIEEIIENIKSNNYNLCLYSKIISLLTRIQEMDVCKNEIKEAIKYLEINIKNDIVKGEYYEDLIFDGNQTTANLYKENTKNIKILLETRKENQNKKEIKNILNDIDWGKKLHQYCKDNGNVFFNNKAFINILDINSIQENIKNKNIENIYEFYYSLQVIYDIPEVKNYYENDKKLLVKMMEDFKKINKIDKVKKYALNLIICYLDDLINKL